MQTAPKPLPLIKIDSKKEYKLKKILKSEFRYCTLRYYVKYKQYSAKQSKWQLAENLAQAQDIVLEFHSLHPSQYLPASWGMHSFPGAGCQNVNAARNYINVVGAHTLG